MATAVLIKYLLIALIALCAVAVISGIVKFVRRAGRSAEAQVVKELVNLVNENGLDFVSEPEHPRLISNMNRIYLPQIEKDFPDFEWDSMKRMLETEIKKEFSSRDGFEISETVVSRYERNGKHRTISCESAASYLENGNTKYTCIRSVLAFINSKKLDAEGAETPRALVCPSCGAPLTRKADGEIICEYCNAVVVGEKIWTVTSIKEK